MTALAGDRGTSPLSAALASPSTALVPAPSAQIARATIAAHSKSFALASRLLDTRTRDQTAVVYTWCRRADDAIDECETREHDLAPAAGVAMHELARRHDGTHAAMHELARLRLELAAAYDAADALAPEVGADRARLDPVLAAFGAVARERAIPLAYPAELLAGMAMDVADTRYASMAELRLYCWRVAGVVGLMMTHVFGIDDDRALVNAAHLGIGMQLTNICRDVVEDWQRGRLYLPDELLARHGAGGLAGDLDERRDADTPPALPASALRPVGGTVRELLALADRYYASGDRGLRALPWRAALAVKAASNVYRAIGTRIRARDCDVTAGRATVSTSGKLARVMAAAARITFMRNARAARVPTRTLELTDVPEP
ncbi:MAG: phytoene/squalene synthase family protein [Kofleriaceae bacterium]